MSNQKLSEREKKIGKIGSLQGYGLISGITFLGASEAIAEGNYLKAGACGLFLIGSLYYGSKRICELSKAFKDYKDSLKNQDQPQ